MHIPGSAEQRGTDFRAALEGEARFCRPLRYKGAALLVTAELSFSQVQPGLVMQTVMPCSVSRNHKAGGCPAFSRRSLLLGLYQKLCQLRCKGAALLVTAELSFNQILPGPIR